MAIKSVQFTLNGETYALSLDSSTGKYQKTITAPSTSSYAQTDHVYPMVLEVQDVAGNTVTIDSDDSTYGEQMKLRVKETTAPVISVTSPGADAYLTNSTLSLSIDVTDSGSGVLASSITAELDETSVSLTKTAITNGYRCTYSGTVADGKHTLVVNAQDNDGNDATDKTVSFTVDTVPPTLDISSPAASLITNKQACTVSGTTNDATSGLAYVKIKLNGTDQGSVTVASDGSFSKDLALVSGDNTISVTATDNAGKTTTITRNVNYDPDAPVIVSIDVSESTVNAGEEFTIIVVATD